jgi:hypothetical protein
MTALLVEELDDRVAVTLHRPEVGYAINAAMVRELHDVCARLEEQPRRLLLITGDGGFAPPRLLRGEVAPGELGCKTGQGFFSWEAS